MELYVRSTRGAAREGSDVIANLGTQTSTRRSTMDQSLAHVRKDGMRLFEGLFSTADKERECPCFGTGYPYQA